MVDAYDLRARATLSYPLSPAYLPIYLYLPTHPTSYAVADPSAPGV